MKVQSSKFKEKNHGGGIGEGFTLIELLIVIAIIGILAAVLISVLNPALQRRKAQEATARGNLSKVCLAVVACQSSLITQDSALCSDWSEIGANDPAGQPSGSEYVVHGVWGTGDTDWAGAQVTLAHGCRVRCVVFNDFRDWDGANPGAVRIVPYTGCVITN